MKGNAAFCILCSHPLICTLISTWVKKQGSNDFEKCQNPKQFVAEHVMQFSKLYTGLQEDVLQIYSKGSLVREMGYSFICVVSLILSSFSFLMKIIFSKSCKALFLYPYIRGYYIEKNDMSILSHILQGNLLSEMSRKILSGQF